MKALHQLIIFATLILFIAGCNKEETRKPWNIKIEDGVELYNFSGDTYPVSDGMSASFESISDFGYNGNNQVNSFNTRSKFLIKFGNISGLDFTLILNTNDSATLANLNLSNPQQIRFNSFKQVVKKGIYPFASAAKSPFVFYTDKTNNLWVTDFSQNNLLEIISTTPNTQDNTANTIIAQINFDLGLKGFSFSGTKRIKGTIFSFFTMN